VTVIVSSTVHPLQSRPARAGIAAITPLILMACETLIFVMADFLQPGDQNSNLLLQDKIAGMGLVTEMQQMCHMTWFIDIPPLST
jgi:hypothetical protein